MDSFIDEWQDTPVSSILIINSKGQAENISDLEQTKLDKTKGINLSDRDYFIEGMKLKSNEIFIGKPIIGRISFTDEFLIPISTPIIDSSQSVRVLGVALSLSKVTEKFIQPLKISEEMQIFLFNEKGNVLYSNDSQLISQNVYDLLKEHPLGKEREIEDKFRLIMAKGGEGKIPLELPNGKKKE